jgi:hypothetical protein
VGVAGEADPSNLREPGGARTRDQKFHHTSALPLSYGPRVALRHVLGDDEAVASETTTSAGGSHGARTRRPETITLGAAPGSSESMSFIHEAARRSPRSISMRSTSPRFHNSRTMSASMLEIFCFGAGPMPKCSRTVCPLRVVVTYKVACSMLHRVYSLRRCVGTGRIELPTQALASHRSTTELRPRLLIKGLHLDHHALRGS